MKNTEKIRVKTYSGYKADERPVSLTIEGKEIQLVDVIPIGTIKDVTGLSREEFIAKTKDGRQFKLIHWEDDRWSVLWMKN